MRFARAAKEDPALSAALKNVVLAKIDTSEDEGSRLADEFAAKGIPHFFLMGSDGKIFDRWLGYADVPSWLAIFETALSDPTTIAEKTARFDTEPSAPLASSLGRIRESERNPVEAVRYYREAIRLDPALATEHAADVFTNQARGLGDGHFAVADVKASADAVFALESPKTEDLVLVADRMTRIAKDEGDPSLAAPYVARAVAAAEGSEGWVASVRGDLSIWQALHLDGDKDRALALKREGMDEGWREDPGELNAFAWWCFENGVNLEEAEALAKKGAELETDAKKRAAILDTVAEIRNALGDPADAAIWIGKAQTADPKNEYFVKQRARFDEAARAAQGTR